MEQVRGIVDSTLREGSQTVGVHFSVDQKVAIARGLVALGVEEVEAGIATVVDRDLAATVARCRDEAGVRRLALWARCRQEDIRCALGLKPDVLSLSIPVSDLHIRAKFGRNRAWVLETIETAIGRARDSGVEYVSLGLEDATRAEAEFLFAVASRARQAGAGRIRLADTVGVATPASIADLVRQLGAIQGLEIGVHMHNDFGMASANAIAALEAGAHWADVTVLGLGERAGNSRLEEVAGFLALRAGRPYMTWALRNLAESVAEMCGRSVGAHRAVIGQRIFACETGLHLHGLHNDVRTYEPYDPALVGARREALYGCKVGKKGLLARMRQLGLQGSGPVDGLVEGFRRRCQDLGRPLHDRELVQLVAEQNY